MIIQDIVNGGFQLGAGAAVWFSISRLWEQKRVRGVHWLTISFFLAMGSWNVYFCSHLDQYFSAICAVLVALSNATYLALIFYYLYRERKHGSDIV